MSTPNRSWLLVTACCLSTASTIGLLPGPFNVAFLAGAAPGAEESRTVQLESIQKAIRAAEKNNPNSMILAGHLESEAKLYAEKQNWTDAVKTYRKAVSIREHLASGNTQVMSKTYRQMSDYLVSAKQIDEAEKYAKLALAVWQKNPGDSYTNKLNALHGMVAFYSGIQQPAKEIPYYKQIVDIEQQQNPKWIDSSANLAKLYMILGQYREAEPLLKRCIAAKDENAKSYGNDYQNYDSIPFVLMAATAATRQGHLDEANSYFDRAKNFFDHSKYGFFGDKYPKELLEAYIEYLDKAGRQSECLAYKARLKRSAELETRACLGCGRG